MEKEKKEASAVSVSGKRILGVGTLEELKHQAGTRAFRIDETSRTRSSCLALLTSTCILFWGL